MTFTQRTEEDGTRGNRFLRASSEGTRDETGESSADVQRGGVDEKAYEVKHQTRVDEAMICNRKKEYTGMGFSVLAEHIA